MNPLSYERIKDAIATLSAASELWLRGGFVGATGQKDSFGVFVEAKRNLTALVQVLHGDEKWRDVQDEE